MGVTENRFLRYWFQDAVVHSYPSSAHRVTHVTGVVAPSCKLAMVVYHCEYRKGGREKERRKIISNIMHAPLMLRDLIIMGLS